MENYQPKRLSQNRRPWEFKKKLAAWAAVAITAAAVASYALAYMDKQTASDVTIALGVYMGVNAKGAESAVPTIKR